MIVRRPSFRPNRRPIGRLALRRRIYRAVLEVRVVPNVAAEGFLNGYVWAIPLSNDEATSLLLTAAESRSRRRQRALVINHVIRRQVTRGGMPTFGEPSDYHIDVNHVFLRLQLET